jgi:hypothetical protein
MTTGRRRFIQAPPQTQAFLKMSVNRAVLGLAQSCSINIGHGPDARVQRIIQEIRGMRARVRRTEPAPTKQPVGSRILNGDPAPARRATKAGTNARAHDTFQPRNPHRYGYRAHDDPRAGVASSPSGGSSMAAADYRGKALPIRTSQSAGGASTASLRRALRRRSSPGWPSSVRGRTGSTRRDRPCRNRARR